MAGVEAISTVSSFVKPCLGAQTNATFQNKLLGHDAPDKTINYVTAMTAIRFAIWRAATLPQSVSHLRRLALSGIPQRQAGSEFGYSQSGNPDAYDCKEGLPAPYLLPWDRTCNP